MMNEWAWTPYICLAKQLFFKQTQVLVKSIWVDQNEFPWEGGPHSCHTPPQRNYHAQNIVLDDQDN